MRTSLLDTTITSSADLTNLHSRHIHIIPTGHHTYRITSHLLLHPHEIQPFIDRALSRKGKKAMPNPPPEHSGKKPSIITRIIHKFLLTRTPPKQKA